MATLGILGTIHGDESFRLQKGYTLEIMKEAIVEARYYMWRSKT